ncbi:hypothetical protein DFH06DRAFT_1311636 [Mycena polygramma]|nr:hypothetical protein DFH06DRAFT_1311636 [Mycena polygramma]
MVVDKPGCGYAAPPHSPFCPTSTSLSSLSHHDLAADDDEDKDWDRPSSFGSQSQDKASAVIKNLSSGGLPPPRRLKTARRDVILCPCHWRTFADGRICWQKECVESRSRRDVHANESRFPPPATLACCTYTLTLQATHPGPTLCEYCEQRGNVHGRERERDARGVGVVPSHGAVYVPGDSGAAEVRIPHIDTRRARVRCGAFIRAATDEAPDEPWTHGVASCPTAPSIARTVEDGAWTCADARCGKRTGPRRARCRCRFPAWCVVRGAVDGEAVNVPEDGEAGEVHRERAYSSPRFAHRHSACGGVTKCVVERSAHSFARRWSATRRTRVLQRASCALRAVGEWVRGTGYGYAHEADIGDLRCNAPPKQWGRRAVYASSVGAVYARSFKLGRRFVLVRACAGGLDARCTQTRVSHVGAYWWRELRGQRTVVHYLCGIGVQRGGCVVWVYKGSSLVCCVEHGAGLLVPRLAAALYRSYPRGRVCPEVQRSRGLHEVDVPAVHPSTWTRRGERASHSCSALRARYGCGAHTTCASIWMVGAGLGRPIAVTVRDGARPGQSVRRSSTARAREMCGARASLRRAARAPAHSLLESDAGVDALTQAISFFGSSMRFFSWMAARENTRKGRWVVRRRCRRGTICAIPYSACVAAPARATGVGNDMQNSHLFRSGIFHVSSSRRRFSQVLQHFASLQSLFLEINTLIW